MMPVEQLHQTDKQCRAQDRAKKGCHSSSLRSANLHITSRNTISSASQMTRTRQARSRMAWRVGMANAPLATLTYASVRQHQGAPPYRSSVLPLLALVAMATTLQAPLPACVANCIA